VTRETAGRVKNMLSSANAPPLSAPKASTMQALAAEGACEAYPLSRSVRLYIDEVGALRRRPRNERAEALAAAAGLGGLSIHGDAYVGRVEGGSGVGERNSDFALHELAHDSPWVLEARREHGEAAQRGGLGDTEHLASGDHGLYEWSQTEGEVEVRVRGAPSGRGSAKRVKVSFGRGTSLTASFDGEVVVTLEPLFDRVSPDDCAWTLEEGVLVVTLEKSEARPWATLCLSQKS